MRRLWWSLLLLPIATVRGQTRQGDEILGKVDRMMFSERRILVMRMIIHGERNTRTLTAKSWQRGTSEAFTEFLSPPRDRGTKMLKREDMLWTYSPATDRTILISGHMLRQSMMGSDLSYEDMMEDPHLPNLYHASVSSEATVNGHPCWILELSARKEDIAYFSRKIAVDTARFVILREELYAKSGKLLKTMDVREVRKIQNRWAATSILYRDVLKEGEGTEFLLDSLAFDAPIPDYLFSKAALKE